MRRALVLSLALGLCPALAAPVLGAARTAPGAVAIQPYPPNLTAAVAFEEPSGNRVLDALEEGVFVVRVENRGQGDAYDVEVKAAWDQAPKGVALAARTAVGTVPAGKTVEVRLPVAAAESAPDQKLRVTFSFPEANGFDADPVALSFDTRAYAAPKLVLADFGIDDASGNGQVEPGELVEVTVRIQNVGAGDAVGVKARVELGANVFLAAGAQPDHDLGNLPPGAHKDVQFSFYTNKRVVSGELLPVTLALAEGRGRFEGKEPVKIAVNAPQRRAHEVVVAGEARPEAGAVPLAGGLSIDVDREIPQGAAKNPKAVAVVIGNRAYKKTSPVEFAANGAATVRRYLVQTLGYDEKNILYVEDADLTDFHQLFGTAGNPRGKLYNWVRPGESDVFVYYAGHGVPNPEEKGTPYFVPVSAEPNLIGVSGYPVSVFRTNLEALPARSLTVVVDACFSGMAADGKLLIRDVSPAALKVRDELPAPEGAVFMASAASDQVSTWYRPMRHSTFTYWWLKGIGGAADADGNREITVAELSAYLAREVPYTARREAGQEQTPVVLGDPARVVVKLR